VETTLAPPIKFCDFCHSIVVEPLFQTKRDEEVDIRMCFGEFDNGRLFQMVVVRMTDDDGVYDGNILDVTRGGCVSLLEISMSK